jgi:hypothetical protein
MRPATDRQAHCGIGVRLHAPLFDECWPITNCRSTCTGRRVAGQSGFGRSPWPRRKSGRFQIAGSPELPGQSSRGIGPAARSYRTSVRRDARQRFARKPYCRIRTKPRGRMCWTKRPRNSEAVRVIFRCLVAVGVVLPAKGDAFAVELEQSMIADRNLVRVSAEVAQHLSRSAERRFGISNPVLTKQLAQEGPVGTFLSGRGPSKMTRGRFRSPTLLRKRANCKTLRSGRYGASS